MRRSIVQPLAPPPLVARHLPETFREQLLLRGIDPQLLRPSSEPGVWWYLVVEAHGKRMKHVTFFDTTDPASPEFRPGGRTRTWKQHRKRWLWDRKAKARARDRR